MLIGLVSDHLTKIAFLIIPKKKLRVTTGEAKKQEISLAHDHLEYFSVKVDLHFDYFPSDALFRLLLETPDLKDKLCADRQEHTLLFDFSDISDCFSMNAEPSVDVRQVVHLHENDCAF